MATKKYNWEVALEQTIAKTKAPKSETPGEQPKTRTRQFQAVKGSDLGHLKFNSENPVHQKLVKDSKFHSKVFITDEGPMVDTKTYRNLNDHPGRK